MENVSNSLVPANNFPKLSVFKWFNVDLTKKASNGTKKIEKVTSTYMKTYWQLITVLNSRYSISILENEIIVGI